jgi:hypothetical protein
MLARRPDKLTKTHRLRSADKPRSGSHAHCSWRSVTGEGLIGEELPRRATVLGGEDSCAGHGHWFGCSRRSRLVAVSAHADRR